MGRAPRWWLLLLCLFFVVAVPACAQDTTNHIYKVKKSDTLYGIAHYHGITVDQLINANPEMKLPGYQLHKGDHLYIPTPRNAAATNSKVLRVGVALPLHNVDGDGKRMVEYYRGILLACDSLKRAGYSIDIHSWNLDATADPTILTRDPAAAQCSIIFGPLYSVQVHALAEFCKARDIKLVIPFSITGDDVTSYSQIFQIWQSDDKLNNNAIEAFLKRYKDARVVLIDCNDKTSKKGNFTFGLRNRLSARGQEYRVTNLNSSLEMFGKAFDQNRLNVVVLNTGRSPELNQAIAKLRTLRAQQHGLRVALFGYNEWLMYATIASIRAQKPWKQNIKNGSTRSRCMLIPVSSSRAMTMHSSSSVGWPNTARPSRALPDRALTVLSRLRSSLSKWGTKACRTTTFS